MSRLCDTPLEALLLDHPCVADFLASTGLPLAPGAGAFGHWLEGLADEDLLDAGMQREQLIAHVERLIVEVQAMARARALRVESLTLCAGQDKSGLPESREITVRAGEIVCIVGPTGAGKSRLLADIECLAQGDTPSKRQILINGQAPSAAMRRRLDGKLVAQLSQNMNFVMDLAVQDFIGMHARCRHMENPERLSRHVIACANELAGEKFSAATAVTELSGGQTRALMIADAALLSASPIVLIDEIENAGVDRRRALELLIQEGKLVFISTHDPLLALRGTRRIVIRNGGIREVIETSPQEHANLARIEAVDAMLMALRDRLRRGDRIEEEILWPN